VWRHCYDKHLCITNLAWGPAWVATLSLSCKCLLFYCLEKFYLLTNFVLCFTELLSDLCAAMSPFHSMPLYLRWKNTFTLLADIQSQGNLVTRVISGITELLFTSLHNRIQNSGGLPHNSELALALPNACRLEY